MIIAISGLHETGKSVVGKAIAERFGLTYFSTGVLFRTIAKEKGLSLEQLSPEIFDIPEKHPKKCLQNLLI